MDNVFDLHYTYFQEDEKDKNIGSFFILLLVRLFILVTV